MDKILSRKIGLIAILLIAYLFTKAQQTSESFVLETKYLLYLPDGYASDTSTRWPLLIFLHGSGESGTDLEKVKVHGPPKLIGQGKKFPFIVVSPQAPPGTGWRAEILKSMLDELKKKYRVDGDRVYLTGLSMGGFGTWDLATKYPEQFAAIAPICGGGETREVWKLRHMPVWCFHGAKDDVVPPAASQRMVDSLRKYNPAVRFTLYPDANHNSWDVTYDNDSLYTWLLAQKQFRYRPVKVKTELLMNYEGSYVNALNKDTVKLQLKEGKLIANPGRENIVLEASSDTSFYWDANSLGEVVFSRNKQGAVGGFVLRQQQQVEFRKLNNKK